MEICSRSDGVDGSVVWLVTRPGTDGGKPCTEPDNVAATGAPCHYSADRSSADNADTDGSNPRFNCRHEYASAEHIQGWQREYAADSRSRANGSGGQGG